MTRRAPVIVGMLRKLGPRTASQLSTYFPDLSLVTLRNTLDKQVAAGNLVVSKPGEYGGVRGRGENVYAAAPKRVTSVFELGEKV